MRVEWQFLSWCLFEGILVLDQWAHSSLSCKKNIVSQVCPPRVVIYGQMFLIATTNTSCFKYHFTVMILYKISRFLLESYRTKLSF